MKIFQRIDALLRPGSHPPDGGDPAALLTADLLIAAVGLGLFGFLIARGGDLGWRALVAGKVAAAFLIAFLVSVAPMYAMKRFFDVETPFGAIVAAFARHLALGAIFAAAGGGTYALIRTGDAATDGALALCFVAASAAAVVACRARNKTGWLPPLPAGLVVLLFLCILAQSGWAFRPYMDPRGPTLFASRSEWFAGAARSGAEDLVRSLAGHREAP